MSEVNLQYLMVQEKKIPKIKKEPISEKFSWVFLASFGK